MLSGFVLKKLNGLRKISLVCSSETVVEFLGLADFYTTIQTYLSTANYGTAKFIVKLSTMVIKCHKARIRASSLFQ
jgi:hypothetical protein